MTVMTYLIEGENLREPVSLGRSSVVQNTRCQGCNACGLDENPANHTQLIVKERVV
jgi:hypothetical protein